MTMNIMTNVMLAAVIGLLLGTAAAVIQEGPGVLSPATSFHHTTQARGIGTVQSVPPDVRTLSPGVHTGLFD
jgi:hypothetical protein